MAVHGYVGLPGAGKTYCAVEDALKFARHYKKPLFTNVVVRPPAKWGLEVHIMDDLEDFLDAKDGIVLLDELGTWMPSRLYTKTKADLIMRWAQVRKYRLYEILYTAQTLQRVDSVVRELTWDVLELQSFRMLGFFWGTQWAGALSGAKKKVGWRIRWIDKGHYQWYDTMQIIEAAASLRD